MRSSLAETAERIQLLGDQLVILDIDLASLLGIAPGHLNALMGSYQATIAREFAFSVSHDETRDLVRAAPDASVDADLKDRLVYTEYGVIVVCSLLDDPQAIQLSIDLVRMFVARRERMELARQSRPRPELH